MTRILMTILAVASVASWVGAKEPVRERIEWTDIWVTNANKNDLPRVLLIGDSITRGYFSGVERELGGKANCARLTTSQCVADPAFLDQLQLLLKQYHFAVIHFNNGLHGWGYSEDQYQAGLAQLVKTLKTHAGGARLIWATTTPVSESGNVQQISARTQRVIARNKIAAKIMNDHGIAIDDLYTLVRPHPEWHGKDGVHFNQKGKAAQVAAVVASILRQLKELGIRN